MQLLFIRHGETDWNVQGRCQGHTDIPLNHVGKKQAENLYQQLKDDKIDAIYCSDLQRAVQTIEIAANELKLPIHKTEALRERDYGEWEGKILAEVLAENSVNQAVLQTGGKYGIERTIDVQKRMVTFIRHLTHQYPNGTVILVSHGAAICSCISELTEGKTNFKVSEIKHASPIVLKSEKDHSWTVYKP